MSQSVSTSSAAPPLAYQNVKQILIDRLRTGWPKDARLPAVHQLAHELGTGKTNTHRAVKELADEGMLISKPGMGTYVVRKDGESLPRPHSHPKSTGTGADAACELKDKHIEVLGVGSSVGHIEGFGVAACDAFTEAAEALGARVTRKPCIADDADSYMPDDDVDAVVVFNPHPDFPLIPSPNQVMLVISTGLQFYIAGGARYDVVSVDQDQGGYIAGRAIKDAGYHDAFFLGCNPDLRESSGGRPDQLYPSAKYDLNSMRRLRGFELGLGHAVPEAHQVTVEMYADTCGARIVSNYMALNPRPEAVFAASDELAIGFISGGLAMGIEPGRDYQIVGFDGQDRARKMPEGPLATVRVPVEQMGLQGANLLLASRFTDRMQPERRLLLSCEFWEGKTLVSRER